MADNMKRRVTDLERRQDEKDEPFIQIDGQLYKTLRALDNLNKQMRRLVMSSIGIIIAIIVAAVVSK